MESFFFHPRIVHLPIALGVLMPAIAGSVLLAWWRGWLPARTWILVVGLQAVLFVSAIVATRTGESDEQRVEEVLDEALIEAHEESGKTLMVVSGVVFGVMVVALLLIGRRAAFPVAALATAGTLVVLVLTYITGGQGGALVYEHGAADAYLEPKGGNPPPQAP